MKADHVLGKYGTTAVRQIAPVLLGWALAAALPTATADAAGLQKHSGRLVNVGRPTQAITLEEMGPWTGPDTRPVRRSFEVFSTTRFELIARSDQAPPDGWPGGFTASRLAASDVRASDYVTVTAEHRDRRSIAASIAVVRPSSP